MISKKNLKFLISLQEKRTRDKEQLFIIEGDKLVKEFLEAKNKVRFLVAKPEFIDGLRPELKRYAETVFEISYEELKKISSLKTPHNALAVVSMPEKKLNIDEVLKHLCVALDFVQDPGNLGTIIRAAAWFGIKNIICSENCVDVYNTKVIQSSMGAILHVNVFYYSLPDLLIKTGEKKLPVYGTLLNGNSIYNYSLINSGVILLGNESKGISNELLPYITDKIMIPGIGTNTPGIESLNVSMAASIVFAEFYRRSLNKTL
jgi:RNA methyltransferase, TrmH family